MKKIVKLFKLLKSQLWIKGLFFGIPANTELEELIFDIDTPETIIDIGSNKGQFILLIEKNFPQKMIYSFEPILEMINKQKTFFKDNKNIRYYNLGLGNTKENKNFLITSRMDSSSFLEISNKDNGNNNYDIKEERKLEIDKLDNILDARKLKRPILIKIDVQGFELETLKGASKILPNVDYIILEVSSSEMYKNQPTEDVLVDYLRNYNFEIFKSNNWIKIKKTNFVQRDIIFKKKNNE